MDALPVFKEWLNRTKPVMPVIALDDAEDAVPLAKALVAGGIHLQEITLRTPAAWESIEHIIKEVPDAIVGAGTVLQVDEVERLAQLGVKYIVSPGFSDDLAEICKLYDLPYLPGVATATEIMRATQAGFNLLKLFPAAVVGGVPALKAFSGPFKDVRFCPTGGISEENYLSYLEQDNVCCIGGSWVSPSHLIEQGDWAAIELLSANIQLTRSNH